MKNRIYTDYVNDMLDSIKDIASFIKGMKYSDFQKDKKTKNAVIRSIEVIGEASKRIPENVRSKYKNIPWKKMAGMRDKMIHEYSGVDDEILWKVASEEITKLKSGLAKVLKDM